MCLAVPMQLVTRRDDVFPEGDVDRDGVRQTVSLLLLPDAAVGDWVLVHAGYAIGRVDAEEAAETLSWLDEMSRAAPETSVAPEIASEPGPEPGPGPGPGTDSGSGGEE